MGSITDTASYKRLVHLLSDSPPTSCKAEIVNFSEIGLPEYDGLFALLIHDAFSPDECQAILDVAQASNNHEWDQALVNIGNGQQALSTDIRLCDRIIWDDEAIASKLLDRTLPHLPAEVVTLRNCAKITGKWPVMCKETWRISRLNDRLRFLRYTSGMYFRPHCDGTYTTPDGEEQTYMTVHLYLNGGDSTQKSRHRTNDDDAEPLVGGATRFFSWRKDDHWDVDPKAGTILVFQHKDLLHSGEDVLQGTKYTVRSDILYKKVQDE